MIIKTKNGGFLCEQKMINLSQIMIIAIRPNASDEDHVIRIETSCIDASIIKTLMTLKLKKAA